MSHLAGTSFSFESIGNSPCSISIRKNKRAFFKIYSPRVLLDTLPSEAVESKVTVLTSREDLTTKPERCRLGGQHLSRIVLLGSPCGFCVLGWNFAQGVPTPVLWFHSTRSNCDKWSSQVHMVEHNKEFQTHRCPYFAHGESVTDGQCSTLLRSCFPPLQHCFTNCNKRNDDSGMILWLLSVSRELVQQLINRNVAEEKPNHYCPSTGGLHFCVIS
jgi:hypothetical protein